MKKYIVGAILSIGILASPIFTQASGLTNAQIQSILSLLSAFGADNATIANVNIALTGGVPTTGTAQVWCHTFNTNLKIGDQNEEVTNLMSALVKEGFLDKDEVFQDGRTSLYFDETTAATVVSFQSRYGIRPLSGYVGPITRAKLNKLYGCSSFTPAVRPVSSEEEILSSLKNNWSTIQAQIQFRPTYHDQNAQMIWVTPGSVQFIGSNYILVTIGDDNDVHVLILRFDGNKFTLLETFKKKSHFTVIDWQNVVNKYGDSSYSVSTYTTGLVRDGQIVSFQTLTKVPENVFIKNYWQ